MVIWGFEGTGKSLWPMKYMPGPVMVDNLDRPLTKAHLGGIQAEMGRERVEQIFYQNLRESVDALTGMEAVIIKQQIEEDLSKNLDWLKGGTFLLDGGTMYRDVLKLADPKLGPKIENGIRFNPKDKAAVNAYLGALISWIQDRGINFVLTAHAAFSWKMVSSKNDDGEVKQQLARTTNVYPKFDDIAFERSNCVLLMFKRCECGRNIVSQDGTCEGAVNDPTNLREQASGVHQGRKHMTRIVTNKFNTSCEGTIWEDLDYSTLSTLSFGTAKKVAQLIASNDG